MKKVYIIFLTISFVVLNSMNVFAEGEWGENVKNWVAKQASYLAIAAVLIVCIPLILKKAWAHLAITIIASAIALFFINNPDAISALGNILSKIIFGDDIKV